MWCRERVQRRPWRLLLVALLLLLVAWVGAAHQLHEYGQQHAGRGRFDAIVVAGARLRDDGSASAALIRRTERAVELWREARAPVLVLTGGVLGAGPSEALVAAELATKWGVPPSALVLEQHSRTTEENARLARELVGARRVLVVTDAYHVLRCEWIYARHFPSREVVGVARSDQLPWRGALREVLAIGWYALQRLGVHA